MARELTGRKVFAIAASAFGIIIAVNFFMARQAIHTFPGLEVDNSYVASQIFDKERKAQEALGWTLATDYRDGALHLAFNGRDGQPVEVKSVSAKVGRVTNSSQDITPSFQGAFGRYFAPMQLEPGKWMVMLEAYAPDGTKFHQRIDLFVKG